MATQRTCQHLGTLHTQAHTIVLDSGERCLGNTAELCQLVLAVALQLANNAYRFPNRDLNTLLRWAKLIHSGSPIVVSSDRDDLKTHVCSQDPVDDSILQPKPRRAITLQLAGECLIVEPHDLP